jgi:hypothetical protein
MHRVMRTEVFTEEAMTRPLFEELTCDHAREDEWSGPHGFAIGGMMQANAASLAEEYFTATNELVCMFENQLEVSWAAAVAPKERRDRRLRRVVRSR